MGRVKNVNFSKRVAKTLQEIDERTKARLKEAIRELSLDPLLGKSLKGEFEGLRCHRAGSFRIVYRTTDGLLEAVYLDHQNDRYR